MTKALMLMGLITFMFIGLINCGKGENGAWQSGDYGKIPIQLDMKAVEEAFFEAKDPQNFEEKVNEIYTGEDIISIFVQSPEGGNQAVTLYFDNEPVDGKYEDSKDTKIATLTRTNVDSANKRVEYQTTGYGPYSYYSHPPMYHSLTGALVSYWIMSRVFYPRPYYYTPMSRHSVINRSRSNYRSTPAYKQRQKTSQSLTRSFNNDPKSKSLRSNVRSSGWGSKTKSGSSWGSGSKSAKSTSSTRSSSSRSSSSGWGGSKRSSGRSFGGRRRR